MTQSDAYQAAIEQIEPRPLTRDEIATIVIESRRLRQWSQENLAAEAHVTTRTVQRLEAADPIVGVDTLRRVEKAVGMVEGFFTAPVRVPTTEQFAELQAAFEAKYVQLDATELRTGQQIVAFVGSISAWQPSHERREGEDAQAIAALLDFIREMVEYSLLDDCTHSEKLAMAQDLEPLLDEVHQAGLKVYSTTRKLRFGTGAEHPGVPMQVGYVRVSGTPMRTFIFDRADPSKPL